MIASAIWPIINWRSADERKLRPVENGVTAPIAIKINPLIAMLMPTTTVPCRNMNGMTGKSAPKSNKPNDAVFGHLIVRCDYYALWVSAISINRSIPSGSITLMRVRSAIVRPSLFTVTASA